MAIDIDKADRDRKIVLDRRAGYDYREIAERNGVALGTVHNVLKKHVESVIKPATEELVQLEIERLDSYILALQGGIASGDPKAIDVARKLSESRRKLTGVDASTKIEVEHTASSATLELQERLNKALQSHAEPTE